MHAIVLAGGSAFGLEAASGVRRYLEQRGVGFPTGAAMVPIVPAAILYDLGIGKPDVRPTREMGEAAAAAATDGAVCRRLRGRGHRRHRGQDLRHEAGHEIGHRHGHRAARAAACWSPRSWRSTRSATCAIPTTGKIVAGARRAPDSLEFAGSAEQIKRGALRRRAREHHAGGGRHQRRA